MARDDAPPPSPPAQWLNAREGRFNLEVMMGSAPAASRLLVELPRPVRWQGFKRKTFGGRPGDEF